MDNSMLPKYDVVAAVIMDGGEILCVQKPQTKYPYTSYHWEFPGGKVEPGESEQQALVRELQEEMCYSIVVEKPLCTINHSYPDFCVCLHFWLCHPADVDNPRKFVLNEHVASCWRRPDLLWELSWCDADKDKTLQDIMRKLCK